MTDPDTPPDADRPCPECGTLVSHHLYGDVFMCRGCMQAVHLPSPGEGGG